MHILQYLPDLEGQGSQDSLQIVYASPQQQNPALHPQRRSRKINP